LQTYLLSKLTLACSELGTAQPQLVSSSIYKKINSCFLELYLAEFLKANVKFLLTWQKTKL
jgi:hypothetical protein